MLNNKHYAAIVFLAITGLLAGFFAYKFYFVKPIAVLSSQTHYSYFSQSGFFNDAYAAAKPQSYNPNIKGILVNHHLLAANFIAETFGTIATNAPVTILLISPNHFSAGKGNFITSNGLWKTPYGILQPDSNTIKKISDAGLADVEESPFGQEHGISGIVAFIKKSLPNAKVIPLIFNDRVTLEQSQALANQYYKILSPNTLIVGSFDFSHYLTSNGADFHDINNLAAVEGFDFSKIYRLDMNSRPGLAFFLELMKDKGDQDFHLLENSNSAKLVHQDILETTSYIDGYYIQGDPSTAKINTTLAFPPIVLSQTVADSFNRYNKNWSVEYLERLFTGQDKTIVEISGDENPLQRPFKRYGFTNIISNQNIIQVAPNITINEHAQSDSITFNNNAVVISRKNNWLSDSILKNGGVSVVYGFAFSGSDLDMTILPIETKDGVSKLLTGKQSDIVLADIAAHSSAQLELEIKTGKITINNFSAQGGSALGGK